MTPEQTLESKLSEALHEFHAAKSAKGAKGAFNLQALIAAIMQLIAAFSGGNTPAPTPAPPKS